MLVRRRPWEATVSVEVCDECGFDGENWTDSAAVEAIGLPPSQWQAATAGLDVEDVARRPIPDMWSIGEYVDHVREVLFGMRFVLDSAAEHPGINLGDALEPVFSPTPRIIDLSVALEGLALLRRTSFVMRFTTQPTI